MIPRNVQYNRSSLIEGHSTDVRKSARSGPSFAGKHAAGGPFIYYVSARVIVRVQETSISISSSCLVMSIDVL